MRDPGFELDCEAFSELLDAYRKLAGTGAPVDPTFAALMRVLELQAIGTDADADGDFDEADELLDAGDDPDADDSDQWLPEETGYERHRPDFKPGDVEDPRVWAPENDQDPGRYTVDDFMQTLPLSSEIRNRHDAEGSGFTWQQLRAARLRAREEGRAAG